MAELSIGQLQNASQVQIQKLSQLQIQTLELVGMSSMDLRSDILKTVEENPALEIVSDSFSQGTAQLKGRKENPSVHLGTSSASGDFAAQEFQKMLESAPAARETLQDYLLQQLNMSHFSNEETALCKKIIQSLDQNGFYIVEPSCFLEPEKPFHTEAFLKNCISKIQHFDPVGICVKNVSESLLVQAKLSGVAPDLALFILNGHLELISPPNSEKARKKILEYIDAQNKLAFRKPEPYEPQKSEVQVDDVQEAIEFIQSLDPSPARDFGIPNAQYIRPDIYVTRNNGILEKSDFEKGFVQDTEHSFFRILPANDTIPVVQVAEDFKKAGEKVSDEKQSQFVKIQLKNAEAFVDSLNFRNMVIVSACSRLVQKQIEFFRKGPGHLEPINQRQFAEMIGVHESTVSRIADSKFIHCDWGIFPIKYFFSNSIRKKVTLEDVSNKEASSEVSADTVRIEIEKILSTQKPGEKRLSDQKIADLLAQKGYQIARRTVAKYRAQLNIASSYER